MVKLIVKIRRTGLLRGEQPNPQLTTGYGTVACKETVLYRVVGVDPEPQSL